MTEGRHFNIFAYWVIFLVLFCRLMIFFKIKFLEKYFGNKGEHSGSVEECLTPDWGTAGSSSTGVTVCVLEQDTIILA